MIKKFCDLCKKQVPNFSQDRPTGRSQSEFESLARVTDVCPKCFTKIEKALDRAVLEADKFLSKRIKELLALPNEDA